MSITKKLGISLGAVLIAGLLFFGGASFLLPNSPIGSLVPYTICSGGVYIDKFGRLFGDRTPVAEAAPCGYTDADAVAAAEAEDPFDHSGIVNFNWNAIRIYNPLHTFYSNINAPALLANRTLTLPLTSGTLALTSGVPPIGATYITQTPDGDLTNEQALSALASGIMRVATATGVVTSLTTSADIAANISDETGTGALVFANSPVLTTPALGTPASGLMTNVTGVPASAILAGSLGAGAYIMSSSLQLVTIELGHATDTTLSRAAAGRIAVEGVNVPTISSTDTFTNKTIGGANATLPQVSTTDRVAAPRRVATLDANRGPFLNELVAGRVNVLDNTLTDHITVTVPNNYVAAIILVDWVAGGDSQRTGESGQVRIDIVRRGGQATAKALAVTLVGVEQQSGPDPDALTVTWTVDANVGAITATQTFNIEVTVVGSSAGYVAYAFARVISGGYFGAPPSEITMALAP